MRFTSPNPWIWILLVAALPGLPLRAEVGPSDPDFQLEGAHRLGPFRLRPFLMLKDAGYDDNIRLEESDSEGDVTATLAPGFRALVRAGDRGAVHLFQEFDYVAFGSNEELSHWNNRTRVKGLANFRSVFLALEDQFDSLRERPNLEIDRRVRKDQNDFRIVAGTAGSGPWSARVALRRSRVRFSSDEPETIEVPARLNREEEGVEIRNAFRFLPKTSLLLEGQVERIDFADDREGRDIRSFAVLSGLRFDRSASLRGEAKLGVLSLEAPQRPASDYQGWVGEGGLTTDMGRRGRIHGAYSRSLGFSTLPENLYFVSTFWSADYEHFFTRRFSAGGGYHRGRNRYPPGESGTVPADSGGFRKDRLESYELTFRYRMRDGVTASLRAARQRRDSTVDSIDEARKVYGFAVAYEF